MRGAEADGLGGAERASERGAEERQQNGGMVCRGAPVIRPDRGSWRTTAGDGECEGGVHTLTHTHVQIKKFFQENGSDSEDTRFHEKTAKCTRAGNDE